MNYLLLTSVLVGIAVLLWLIVKAKWPAFVALLFASLTVGVVAGMPVDAILKSMEKGMGGTLGYVATIVGLGAIFGGILEKSNGAQVIAQRLLALFGMERAPTAMALAGFIIAIPVFFDVAFIILFPVLIALQRKTGKSVLHFALPLLAGLVVGHAFVPPTPGPIAVANIIGADLGWVIVAGLLTGFPTALIAGVWLGRQLAKRVEVLPPELPESHSAAMPSPALIFSIVALPIALILLHTCISTDLFFATAPGLKQWVALIGHPFFALLIANISAWYLLRRKMGFSKAQLADISNKSFQPAGIIILVTGAGGVFKQILVDTDAGEMLAQSAAGTGLSAMSFAFIAAAMIRLMQGSATVAMATAAGLVAPLLEGNGLSGIQLAAIVMAIAAGASILSHVNDSGFWLVKEYLGLSERQTFQTWSMLTTGVALAGFLCANLVYWMGT